jgi:hypothetical protein
MPDALVEINWHIVTLCNLEARAESRALVKIN